MSIVDHGLTCRTSSNRDRTPNPILLKTNLSAKELVLDLSAITPADLVSIQISVDYLY